MIYTILPPPWLRDANASARPKQLNCDLDTALRWNEAGYGLFYYPNGVSAEAWNLIPVNPKSGRKRFIQAPDIDKFEYVILDFDAKHGKYESVEAFIEVLLDFKLTPTSIRKSGRGVHALWRVSDLDAMSYLRLTRRLAATYNTDPAVAMVKQLLRVPGSWNTKDPDNFLQCELFFEDDSLVYTAEEMDKALPAISQKDEEFCQRHYESVYNPSVSRIKVAEDLPASFLSLCRTKKDISSLYFDEHKNRSSADWALGLALFEHGLSKEDAMSVLCRTEKAMERTEAHRYTYGENIVNKIWVEEQEKVEAEQRVLKYPPRNATAIKKLPTKSGKRIVCSPLIDATKAGFRRGQVLGLIGATGNGKSSFTLNMIRWFAEHNSNQDMIYLYVSLEMSEKEIEAKWGKMTAQLKLDRPDIDWDSLLYVLGNFDDDGAHRAIGNEDIAEHAKGLEELTGKKVGVIAIDHIGIVKQKKSSKLDEKEGLIGVCKELKPLAAQTDSFVIAQSQTSRSNGASGDTPLSVSAAFGVSSFEWYSDHIVTIWQPLRKAYGRMDKDNKLCVTAFQLAKTRDKNVTEDLIQTDTPYGLSYDPASEVYREMTSDEMTRFEFWNRQATAIRNQDQKKEAGELVAIGWTAPGSKGLDPTQNGVKHGGKTSRTTH